MSDKRIVYLDPHIIEKLADEQINWGNEPQLSVCQEDVFAMTEGLLTEAEQKLIQNIYVDLKSYDEIASEMVCVASNVHWHERRLHKKIRKLIDTETLRETITDKRDLYTDDQWGVISKVMSFVPITDIARELNRSRTWVYNILSSLNDDVDIQELFTYH